MAAALAQQRGKENRHPQRDLRNAAAALAIAAPEVDADAFERDVAFLEGASRRVFKALGAGELLEPPAAAEAARDPHDGAPADAEADDSDMLAETGNGEATRQNLELLRGGNAEAGKRVRELGGALLRAQKKTFDAFLTEPEREKIAKRFPRAA